MIICAQPSYNFAHISLAAGSTGRIGQSGAFLSEKEFGRRRAIEAQQEFCFLRMLERDPLSRNSAHSGIYRGTLLTGANAEGFRLRQMQSVGPLCAAQAGTLQQPGKGNLNSFTLMIQLSQHAAVTHTIFFPPVLRCFAAFPAFPTAPTGVTPFPPETL